MLAVVPHDAVLDFAWKDMLRACLQHDPPPQYVVFTNQRDLQLYDLARDREIVTAVPCAGCAASAKRGSAPSASDAR